MAGRICPIAAPACGASPAKPAGCRPGRPSLGGTALDYDNGLGGFSPDGKEYVIRLENGQIDASTLGECHSQSPCSDLSYRKLDQDTPGMATAVKTS